MPSRLHARLPQHVSTSQLDHKQYLHALLPTRLHAGLPRLLVLPFHRDPHTLFVNLFPRFHTRLPRPLRHHATRDVHLCDRDVQPGLDDELQGLLRSTCYDIDLGVSCWLGHKHNVCSTPDHAKLP